MTTIPITMVRLGTASRLQFSSKSTERPKISPPFIIASTTNVEAMMPGKKQSMSAALRLKIASGCNRFKPGGNCHIFF